MECILTYLLVTLGACEPILAKTLSRYSMTTEKKLQK